ncbi:MAG: hypothetical protein ACI845_002333 [Gammaproteobacteria bacterium]|jgi:hypothetical protein
MNETIDVLRFRDVNSKEIENLLKKYDLQLRLVADNSDIPGSFWGDEEAGLVGKQLFLRRDTPIHSILHEAGHYICMNTKSRTLLDTNAGNSTDEENAVCYLQILLSEDISQAGQQRMMQDMDRWQYSFRLGTASAWFNRDADDTRQWLIYHNIIASSLKPTGFKRK